MSITDELRAKLLSAGSAEEAAAVMKEAGEEITPEDAARLFEEIGKAREEDDLSLDELEAVSGGGSRNWVTEGCAATVELGSHCSSNDSCWWRDVTYDYGPTSRRCPNCGKHMYVQNRIKHGGVTEVQYRCKYCGLIESEWDSPHEYDAGLQ